MTADAELTAGHGLDGHLGLEFLDPGPEDVMRGRVPVGPQLLQAMGIVHGGVYAAVAESLASVGTWIAVNRDGVRKVALGMSNQTTFLRPMTEGTIHAEAVPRHRGRTTWVWDVECSDDQGRVCAISRMTVAVRDLPA